MGKNLSSTIEKHLRNSSISIKFSSNYGKIKHIYIPIHLLILMLLFLKVQLNR